ncbi:hypothetical protein LR48_Vigan03g141100 [Vigna angularis]|uniref:Uncharacterized protein n=1 Tax=Phaseolus angularis TaxID=3914 RepID=A0A0L9U6J1_PHAAN|nr:hypothetical protein LR48_Vigan03g141100 [Vigna angularis]
MALIDDGGDVAAARHGRAMMLLAMKADVICVAAEVTSRWQCSGVEIFNNSSSMEGPDMEGITTKWSRHVGDSGLCESAGLSWVFGFEGFHGSAKKIKAREALFTVAYMEELWSFDNVEKLAIKVRQFGVEHLCDGENVGQTHDWVIAICSSVYGGCHGNVIWLPKKMKGGIVGAMFGADSAFGPFHVFYEMR